MKPQEKLEMALEELKNSKAIISFSFSKDTNKFTGTAYIGLQNASSFRKIYFNRLRHISTMNGVKEHVSAIRLSISGSTTIARIKDSIMFELKKLQTGEWAEGEAEGLFKKLKEDQHILGYRRSTPVQDVMHGFDFVITVNCGRSLKIDVTTSKEVKGRKEIEKKKKRGIYVFLVNSEFMEKQYRKQLNTILRHAKLQEIPE
jgi:hypothetical protein